MSTYAVGDIQGCLEPLICLLESADFDPQKDRLWVAGDLINRGPKSLESLRYLYHMRDSITVVLGNHDLHLLAVAEGIQSVKPADTLQEILDAPDCDELLNWLRQQKLVHCENGYVMSHAGIPPCWTIEEAQTYSQEIEAILRGADLPNNNYHDYLKTMYGNEPECWRR